MKVFRLIGLLFLLVICTSFLQAQNSIVTYNSFIQSAKLNNLSSIEDVSIQFAKIFKDGTIAEKDSAIILFWEYYNTVASQQTTLLNNKTLPDYFSSLTNITDYPSEKTKQLLVKKGVKYSQADLDYLAELNKFGYKIVTEEGMYDIKIGSIHFFEAKFKLLLSENTFNYFIKLIEQESNPFSYDAAIVKDLTYIADNLIWWEKFLDNDLLPYYKEYGNYHYKNLLFTLLEGQDNTPAFDYNSKKISKNFGKCYEYIAKKYEGTKTADIFKKLTALLKKSKNKKSKQIEDFIRQL